MQLYLFEYLDELPQFDYSATTPRRSGTSTRTASRTVSSSTRTASARSTARTAGAMGEAWSDWYAEDLLIRQGFETDDPDVAATSTSASRPTPEPHITRSEAIDCAGRRRLGPGGRLPRRRNTGPGGYTLGDFGEDRRRPRGPRRRRDLGADAVGPAPERSSTRRQRRRRLRRRRAADHERHAPVAARAEHARDAQRDPAGRHGQWRRPATTSSGRCSPTAAWATTPRPSTVRHPSGRELRHAAGRRHAHGRAARPVPTPRPARPCRAHRAPRHRDGRAGRDAARPTSPTPTGRYELSGVTEGTYGKLAVRPARRLRPGRRPEASRSAAMTTVTKDVQLDRNWISQAGGGAWIFVNDATFDDVRLRARALIDDTDDGSGWVANKLPAIRRAQRQAGVDVRAAQGGRRSARSRSTQRRAASSSAPRRHSGLQARGVVRRHDVPDVRSGSFTPDRGRPAHPARADRHRRQERQADPPDDEPVVRPGRGLHGPRLHQRLAARGVRRGAERAAVRLADPTPATAAGRRCARRVVVQGPGLADHRLRLGLRRQRQRGSLHDRADDVVRLREHGHVHPEVAAKDFRGGTGTASTT